MTVKLPETGTSVAQAYSAIGAAVETGRQPHAIVADLDREATAPAGSGDFDPAAGELGSDAMTDRVLDQGLHDQVRHGGIQDVFFDPVFNTEVSR